MSRVAGILEALLHAGADAVVVVLRLDERERNVRLVIEDVVSPLGPAPGDQLASDNDAALGESNLFADLRHLIPASLPDRRGNELGTDVAFAEELLVHAPSSA